MYPDPIGLGFVEHLILFPTSFVLSVLSVHTMDVWSLWGGIYIFSCFLLFVVSVNLLVRFRL